MCERELETEQNCNILTPTLMAISVSFPFTWAVQPGHGGPASLDAGFLYRILSPTCLIPKLNLESRRPLLLGAGFLYHILSPNSLNFLCTELYNSSTFTQSLMHFRRLWNSMFDRHRAEIIVMQFTGDSLPVHQFVTVLWDFNPVPYYQPSSPTSTEYALPPSLEWHVWPSRRSIYNI